MEWDGLSDASSNAWSKWNWSSWKETMDSPRYETHAMRIVSYEEAPLPEPVLSWFFYQRADWRQERET